ncbi:hypothetical protein ASPCAL06874 [Aspergillus calidoustus]|uniref:Cytochrome P450 n=1 Tax=Aspergillus calidoustus TaxID=454130 RepID=A0A0U5G840_ASPCI|nr:hypothetical protein ASPCAL06874 [Aspergillus calidoustus]
MGMKSGNGEDVLEFKENHTLQGRLSAVFNAKHKNKGKSKSKIDIHDPHSNPLSWILPGFETLWRIVLRLFPVLDSSQREEDYRQILPGFVHSPTPTQFKLESDDERISAESLVKEALRLYPPTRRIRRAFQFAGGSTDPNSNNRVEVVTAAADVEACQLDTDLWGADAMQFNPARWRKEENFLAFGDRPFLCPASRGFDPMVICAC